MSLQSRLADWVAAVGADIKTLTAALPARETITKNGHASGNSTIAPPAGRTAGTLHQITGTAAGRLRVYRTAAQRTADASRGVTIDPIGNHGCVLEVFWTGAGSFDLSSVIIALADSESAWYSNWEPTVAATATDLTIKFVGID